MRSAAAATDLGAGHAVTVIPNQIDGTRIFRFVETRPTAARLELCLSVEQLRVASRAVVGAGDVGVDELSRPRRLGAGLAEYVELFGSEQFAPLGLGMFNLGHRQDTFCWTMSIFARGLTNLQSARRSRSTNPAFGMVSTDQASMDRVCHGRPVLPGKVANPYYEAAKSSRNLCRPKPLAIRIANCAGLSDRGGGAGLVRVDASEQVPHVGGHDCDLICFHQRAGGCGERRHADVRARD